MKSNNDLRMLARGEGVALWEIARELNVSDQKLYRDWRNELSPEDKLKIRKIIEQLKGDGVQ